MGNKAADTDPRAARASRRQRRSDERREHARHDVFGGNAEITLVVGRGRRPGQRARILNWSRGGLLLRVPSPRRRLLFFAQGPALHPDDAIACTLRLPPAYKDIAVRASVVRAARAPDDPDQLEVGLSFDVESTGERPLEELVKLLEPRHLTSWSQRLAAQKQPSQRAPKQPSQRAPKQPSQRAAKQPSQRAAKQPSQRAAKQPSQRLPGAPRS